MWRSHQTSISTTRANVELQGGFVPDCGELYTPGPSYPGGRGDEFTLGRRLRPGAEERLETLSHLEGPQRFSACLCTTLSRDSLTGYR